jgi:hypothetical protein
VPRWVFSVLVAFVATAASGIPAAAAGAVGCGDECGEGHDGAEDDCPDGAGCAPLCSACVCASYAAPAIASVEAPVVDSSAPVMALSLADRQPAIPFLPGVFHPPRPAC